MGHSVPVLGPPGAGSSYQSRKAGSTGTEHSGDEARRVGSLSCRNQSSDPSVKRSPPSQGEDGAFRASAGPARGGIKLSEVKGRIDGHSRALPEIGPPSPAARMGHPCQCWTGTEHSGDECEPSREQRMPKRVIDFDALWASDKLAACAAWAQAEYAWLYGLADGNGSFELTNLRVIWGRVAAIRKNLSLERLEQIFEEFRANGLLFVWEENGKTYGHWTNSDLPGRLPPRWRRQAPR